MVSYRDIGNLNVLLNFCSDNLFS